MTRFRLFIPAALLGLAALIVLPPRPSAVQVFFAGLPLVVLASWLAARHRPERWWSIVRRTADWHALALVLLAALAVQLADAHGVTTDGVIYFSQLRSALFDRDLDVAAEFAFLEQPRRPSHVVPIGPILVWLPLYLAVALVDSAGRALGWWMAPADAVGVGLTLPYIRAALVSSFAIGAVGLAAVHARLRREFPPGVALSSTLLLFGATPLVWYMVYEPSMTHAASFGFVALFVVAAERWTTPGITPSRAATLGALLGLAFVTRPQEALFAIFPAVLLLTVAEPWPGRLRAAGRLAGWALVGVLPFLAVQAVHAVVLMNREPFALAGNGGYLDLLHSRWADTLWSSWHGFFSWTPVAYLAAAGLAWYARRHRSWALAAIVILLAMAWVNGSTADWAGGWSFGGRRFISVLVVLAPGLAMVIHGLVRRPLVPLGLVALVFLAWHQLLMAQYAAGVITPGEVTPFARIVRQQAAMATRPPFVYPFAFPANAWFAWRTGLPIDRYDRLGAESWSSSLDVPMSAASTKYALEGWAAQVSDPFGDLRWLDGPRGELALPLAMPAGRVATLEIRARARQMAAAVPVPVTVWLNGQVLGHFTPDTAAPSDAVFPIPAEVELRAGRFARLVLEKPAGAPPVAVYRVSIR